MKVKNFSQIYATLVELGQNLQDPCLLAIRIFVDVKVIVGVLEAWVGYCSKSALPNDHLWNDVQSHQ